MSQLLFQLIVFNLRLPTKQIRLAHQITHNSILAKLAVIKTKETNDSVEDFIKHLPDEQKRIDSFLLLALMEKISKDNPKLWGSSMIGFGKKVYKSPKTGREVEWFKIGFSPRKANLSLHLVFDMTVHAGDLKKLGKHKTGAGCLYINKLEDVDMHVLHQLIKVSLKDK